MAALLMWQAARRRRGNRRLLDWRPVVVWLWTPGRRLANGRTEGVRTVSDDLRWQGARLSRRSLLKGLAMSASAGVLMACGGGGTSGSGGAATPAARAPVGSGAG